MSENTLPPLPPLSELEQYPEFIAYSPEDKSKFYDNYFNRRKEEAVNEDDYNLLLKEQADRNRNSVKIQQQVNHPFVTDPRYLPKELQDQVTKVYEMDQEYKFNQEKAQVEKFKAPDMEDPNRSLQIKPYKYNGQRGYSIKYPNGEMESVSGMDTKAQLTEYLKTKADKFNGKREGVFDQYNPLAESELEGIIDAINQVSSGFEGSLNQGRKTFKSIAQGFDLGTVDEINQEVSDYFRTGDIEGAQKQKLAEAQKNLQEANASGDTKRAEDTSDYIKTLQRNLAKIDKFKTSTGLETEFVDPRLDGTEQVAFDSPGLLPSFKYTKPGEVLKKGMTPEEAAPLLKEKYIEIFNSIEESNKIGGSRVLNDYNKYLQSLPEAKRGEASALTNYFKNNLSELIPYIATTAVAAFPDIAMVVGSSVAAGAIGGPGAATGTGLKVGYEREYTATLMSEMQLRAAKENVKFDPDVMSAYMNDSAFMEKTRQIARTRGAVIGASGAILGGATSKIVESTIEGAVKKAFIAGGIGSVTEGVGEFAARGAAGQKRDFTEVFNEAIGGLGATAVAIPAAMIGNSIKARKAAKTQSIIDEVNQRVETAQGDGTLKVNKTPEQRIQEMKDKLAPVPRVPDPAAFEGEAEAPFVGETATGLDGKQGFPKAEQKPFAAQQQAPLGGQVQRPFVGEIEQAFGAEAPSVGMPAAPVTPSAPVAVDPIERMRKANASNPTVRDSDDEVDRPATQAKAEKMAAEAGMTKDEWFDSIAKEGTSAKEDFYDSLEDGDVVTWVDGSGKTNTAEVKVFKDGSKEVRSTDGPNIDYSYPRETSAFIQNADTLSVKKKGQPAATVQETQLTEAPSVPVTQTTKPTVKRTKSASRIQREKDKAVEVKFKAEQKEKIKSASSIFNQLSSIFDYIANLPINTSIRNSYTENTVESRQNIKNFIEESEGAVDPASYFKANYLMRWAVDGLKGLKYNKKINDEAVDFEMQNYEYSDNENPNDEIAQLYDDELTKRSDDNTYISEIDARISKINELKESLESLGEPVFTDITKWLNSPKYETPQLTEKAPAAEVPSISASSPVTSTAEQVTPVQETQSTENAPEATKEAPKLTEDQIAKNARILDKVKAFFNGIVPKFVSIVNAGKYSVAEMFNDNRFTYSAKSKRLGVDGFAEHFVNAFEKEINWNQVFAAPDKSSQQSMLRDLARDKYYDISSDRNIYETVKTNLIKYLTKLANRENLEGQAAEAAAQFKANPKEANDRLSKISEYEKLDALNDWKNQIRTLDPYTKAFIWKALTDQLSSETTKTPPVFNKTALTNTLNDIGSDPTVSSFIKVYSKYLAEEYTKGIKPVNIVDLENGDRWIKIPQTNQSDTSFNDNLNTLRSLSCPAWCTSGERMSNDYLQRGDFWILQTEGTTKVAIRFEGDGSVAEIQGPANDGRIPTLYADRVQGLVDSGSISLDEFQLTELKKAIRESKIEERLKQPNLTDRDKFEIFGIEVSKNTLLGGLYLTGNLTDPRLLKVGINFSKVESVDGSINFATEEDPVNFLNLKSVSRDVESLIYAPKLRSIGGKLEVFIEDSFGSPSYQSLEEVGGGFFARNNIGDAISFPKLKHIGKSIALEGKVSLPALVEWKPSSRFSTLNISYDSSANGLKEIVSYLGNIDIEGSVESLEKIKGHHIYFSAKGLKSAKNLQVLHYGGTATYPDSALLESVKVYRKDEDPNGPRYFDDDYYDTDKISRSSETSWDARLRDGRYLEINSDSINENEVEFKIAHEIGHFMYLDPEHRGTIDSLIDQLTPVAKADILEIVNRLYSQNTPESKREEASVRALEEIYRYGNAITNPQDRSIWQKITDYIKRIFKLATGSTPQNPEAIASKVISDGISKYSQLTDVEETAGVPHLRGEVNQDTKDLASVAITTEEKETVARQAEKDIAQNRFNDLKKEYPEILKDTEFDGTNLQQAREKVTEFLEASFDKVDAEGEEVSDAKKAQAAKLQVNLRLALSILPEKIKETNMTDSQIGYVLDAMEYIVNSAQDMANMTANKMRYFNNTLASFADGGALVGMKGVITKTFISKWKKAFDEVRNSGAIFDKPIDTRRNGPFGNLFSGALGTMASLAHEVSYMGTNEAAHRFIRNLMGVFKDNIDFKQLEETAAIESWYQHLNKVLPKISNQSDHMIGIAARLTQWDKAAKASPLEQMIERNTQLTDSFADADFAKSKPMGAMLAFDKEQAAIVKKAYDALMSGIDLASFPDEAAAVAAIEERLSPEQLSVLNKTRDMGKAFLPFLKNVKAVTKNVNLQDYQNYVHDSSITPREGDESNTIKESDSMSDVLHDRKGFNPAITYPETSIRAIATTQAKSSAYEKHTGVERYLFRQLMSDPSFTNALDKLDSSTGISDRLIKLAKVYNESMTKNQPRAGPIISFMESSASLVMAAKILGVDPLIKNATGGLISRLTLAGLDSEAFFNGVLYEQNMGKINAFLKKYVPTQYNRTSQYDIIEGSDERYNFRNKVRLKRELGSNKYQKSLVGATLAAGLYAPQAFVNMVQKEIVSRFSNYSNALPERQSAFAIWTAAYIHYAKKNGTVIDAKDFLARMPHDKRAANDANDFVTMAMGYAPDKASKGSFWNGSTRSKQVLSKTLFGFMQQSTGLAVTAQNQLMKSQRLLRSGDLMEANKALLVASTAMTNVLVFRAMTLALQGIVLYPVLTQYFNGADEEQKKKAILKVRKEYKDTSDRSNLGALYKDAASMIFPLFGSAPLITGAFNLAADTLGVVGSTRSDGSLLEFEFKKALKVQSTEIKDQLEVLNKRIKFAEKMDLQDRPEFELMLKEEEKLMAIKDEIAAKLKFSYVTADKDKAALSPYGMYGMFGEFVLKQMKSFTEDDLTTEQRIEMDRLLNNEITYKDNLAGPGFLNNLIEKPYSIIRKSFMGELGKSREERVPTVISILKQINAGEDPAVILERTRTKIAEELAKKNVEHNRRALELQEKLK